MKYYTKGNSGSGGATSSIFWKINSIMRFSQRSSVIIIRGEIDVGARV